MPSGMIDHSQHATPALRKTYTENGYEQWLSRGIDEMSSESFRIVMGRHHVFVDRDFFVKFK